MFFVLRIKNMAAKQTLRPRGGGGWIRTTEAKRNRFTVCPFGHSGTPPYEIVELVDGFEPPDLLITNQLLYRLSYTSTCQDGCPTARDTITDVLTFVKYYFERREKNLPNRGEDPNSPAEPGRTCRCGTSSRRGLCWYARGAAGSSTAVTSWSGRTEGCCAPPAPQRGKRRSA